MDATDRSKRAAALRACDLVEDAMVVGLGTGSTAAHMVRELGRRVGEGLSITGVPTSRTAADLAEASGIRLVDLDDTVRPDLTIDGADEADGALTLIKGGGGALLREKIVAHASDRMVAIVDGDKRVERLGAYPLPVEVAPFGVGATRRAIRELVLGLGLAFASERLRGDGAPFVTDGGHMIVDLSLGQIEDPAGLDAALKTIPGVVETGLFIGLCDTMIVGHEDGTTEIVVPARGPVAP
jgi:ribose 5-phosphate isomerase A